MDLTTKSMQLKEKIGKLKDILDEIIPNTTWTEEERANMKKIGWKKREQIWKRLIDKEDKMRNYNIHLTRVPESRTDIFDLLFDNFPKCACQLHWITRQEIHAVTELEKEKDRVWYKWNYKIVASCSKRRLNRNTVFWSLTHG